LSTAFSARSIAVAYSIATVFRHIAGGRHLVEPRDERSGKLLERGIADLDRIGVHGFERALEIRKALGASRRHLEPHVLCRSELVARVA
jgi:hypothetical protein